MHFQSKDALMASVALHNLPERPRAIQKLNADAGAGASGVQAQKVLAELQQAFEAYKAAMDEKLKSKADVVVDEKVSRIDNSVGALQAAIDQTNLQLAAMSAGAGTDPQAGQSPEDKQYAKDFFAYFRTGDTQNDTALRNAQRTGIRAAMSVGSSPDGGYLAPVEWDRTVTNKLKILSPMRDICRIQTISTPGFIKVFNDRAVGSGWVGEVAARPQTSNPQFSTVTYTPGEIYANPAASQQLLDDSLVNIEEWLATEVETEFARQEGIAFISGDGTNKPKGVLTYASGSTHPFGNVPSIASGGVGIITPDAIVNLVYDVPSEYVGPAQFIMNRATMASIRKFKDTTNQYLWQPSIQVGQPATILGYPVKEMGAMPNVTTANIAIAFGDFNRGYLIVDRIGVRLLRDPYSNKPYIMFYTTKRVGGGLLDPLALRYLVIG